MLVSQFHEEHIKNILYSLILFINISIEYALSAENGIFTDIFN